MRLYLNYGVCLMDPLTRLEIEGKLLTASAPDGSRWDICCMQEGEVIGRGWGVWAEGLRASLPEFDRVAVQDLRFEGDWRDHLPAEIRAKFPDGVILGNVVGSITNPLLTTLENGKQAILATLNLIDRKSRDLFLHFRDINRLDLLNFSINTRWPNNPQHMRPRILEAGRTIWEILKIPPLHSLDIVTLPGAGGHVRSLLASAQLTQQRRQQPMVLDLLKQYLEAKGLQASGASPLQILASLGIVDDQPRHIQGMTPSDEEFLRGLRGLLASETDDQMTTTLLKTALAAMKAVQSADKDKNDALQASIPSLSRQDIEEMLGMKSELLLNSMLASSGLEADVQDKARAYFAERAVKPTRSEIAAYIAHTKTLLASRDDSGHPHSFGAINVGHNTQDKLRIGMYQLLGSQPKNDKEKAEWQGIEPLHDLQQAYVMCTGDTYLEAPLKGRNARLQASSGLFQPSDFPYVLGDAMHRAVVDIYRAEERQYAEYCAFRRGVRDFRNLKINRIKGMGLLPKYTDAHDGTGIVKRAIPGEEQGTYAVDIYSDRMVFDFKILRDNDIGLIESFVRDYAVTCVDTVNFYAGAALINATLTFDGNGNGSVNVINGGTVYDSKALYHADHANLLTRVLSYEAAQDACLMIRKQKRAGDAGRNLRLAPYAIWYPISLSPVADVIIEAEKEAFGSSNNPNTLRSLKRIMIPEEDLGGSPKNWGVIADPKRLAVVQIAFLDDVEAPWIVGQTQNQTSGAPWDFLRTEYRGVMMFGVGKQAHEAGVMSIPTA